jgi:hypothetical protein
MTAAQRLFCKRHCVPGEEDETATSANEMAEIGEDELLGLGVLLLALEHLSARSPERKEMKKKKMEN